MCCLFIIALLATHRSQYFPIKYKCPEPASVFYLSICCNQHSNRFILFHYCIVSCYYIFTLFVFQREKWTFYLISFIFIFLFPFVLCAIQWMYNKKCNNIILPKMNMNNIFRIYVTKKKKKKKKENWNDRSIYNVCLCYVDVYIVQKRKK